jgi:hypothetical protein
LGLGTLMLWLASATSAAAATAAVSGVVRDAQGMAQVGAMVQALAVGSSSAATAFTDMDGRYRIANLLPGRYQVQATAALFMPALRRNLQLSTGMRATVNLTLSMLSDPTAWLPAQRRRPDEPGDDWVWTLRSAENRPILRMMGDGELVLVSSGASEAPRRAAIQGRASMTGGDGGFGEGGVQSAAVLDRAMDNGSDLLLRAAVSAAATDYGSAPAAELDAGYERTAGLGGASRLLASYQSHPEMMSFGNGGNVAGLQAIRMVSAQKMRFGDVVDVEAGATVYAIHTAGTVLTARPFLRIAVHPGEVWAVRYRLATARDLQGFDDLDSVAADLPVAVACSTRLCTESGTHQEIALSRKVGGGLLQAALYRDAIDRSSIAGTGAISAAEMASDGGSSGVVVDTATGDFELLGAGYTTRGVSVTLSEPLTGSLWAALEYDSGAALAAGNASETGLAETTAALHSETSEAATVALKGRALCSGTELRAAYHWQPRHLVTAVGPYEPFSDQAYLGLYVRQAMRWGNRLPPGLEATIDVTNLLAQGYEPFLSADGRTLFLTQTPRTIQGGLSFTF